MTSRDERFIAPTDDIEVIRKSKRGLIVSDEVLERALARVIAGENLADVAFDVATENVALQGALDNPGMDDAS